MLAEASDEIVDEEEDGIKLEVEGDCNDDMGLLMDTPEMNEDKNRENSDEAQESQQAAVILTLVNILCLKIYFWAINIEICCIYAFRIWCGLCCSICQYVHVTKLVWSLPNYEEDIG